MNVVRARLPRAARLCGAARFTGRFSSRRQGLFFTVQVRDNAANEPAKLGIVAAKSNVPGAVARIRMKRLIREVFRLNRGGLGSVDVVVRVRQSAEGLKIAEARHELEKLLSENR